MKFIKRMGIWSFNSGSRTSSEVSRSWNRFSLSIEEGKAKYVPKLFSSLCDWFPCHPLNQGSCRPVVELGRRDYPGQGVFAVCPQPSHAQFHNILWVLGQEETPAFLYSLFGIPEPLSCYSFFNQHFSSLLTCYVSCSMFLPPRMQAPWGQGLCWYAVYVLFSDAF